MVDRGAIARTAEGEKKEWEGKTERKGCQLLNSMSTSSGSHPRSRPNRLATSTSCQDTNVNFFLLERSSVDVIPDLSHVASLLTIQQAGVLFLGGEGGGDLRDGLGGGLWDGR